MTLKFHLQPPALHLLETYLLTEYFSWLVVKVPTRFCMFFALAVRPWPVIGQMELLAPRAVYPNMTSWAWLQNIDLHDNCRIFVPLGIEAQIQAEHLQTREHEKRPALPRASS